MTNHERIKAMNSEDFANFLFKITQCGIYEDCYACPLQGAKTCMNYGIQNWLEKEEKPNIPRDSRELRI